MEETQNMVWQVWQLSRLDTPESDGAWEDL